MGKQGQAKVGILHLCVGLVGADVPGQDQQVCAWRRFGAEMGVHFKVQVGHQLDLHGVTSLNDDQNALF